MVNKITLDLIRKRAEHNDGELSTLEEITLHQFDLEEISPILQQACPKLKIIFLQSNQISKIENLRKLKRLEYLNLALNNIERVEGLEGCESLKKLDLIVNFIKDLSSLKSLQKNEFLEELYLTGNPCTEVSDYRLKVISILPQLKTLDGIDITDEERQSAEKYKDIAFLSEAEVVKELEEPKEFENIDLVNDKVPHTPSARLATARHLQQLRSQNKPSESKPVKEKTKPQFTKDGKILQKNEPNLKFHFEQTPELLSLHLKVPKYLDSSLLEVQLEKDYILIWVKEQAVFLRLEEEIDLDESHEKKWWCERSINGDLIVYMKKKNVVEEKKTFKSYTGYIVGSKKEEKEKEKVETVINSNQKEEEERQKSIQSRLLSKYQKKVMRQQKPIVFDDQFTDVPPLL